MAKKNKKMKVNLEKKTSALHSTNELKPEIVKKKFELTESEIESIVKRVRIKQLLECGYSYSQISKTLDIDISYTTISNCKNMQWSVSSILPKKSTGRPSIVSKETQKKICKMADSFLQPKQIGLSLKTPLSKSTIRRQLLKDDRYPFVSKKTSKIDDCHYRDRYNFCNEWKDKPLQEFEKLLITDSKIFLLDGGRNRQNKRYWLKDPEDVPNHELLKKKVGLHVYGGMSAKGLTPLIFVEGTLNAERYLNEVLPIMVLSIMNRRKKKGNIDEIMLFDDPKNFIFEQDHASIHDSNIVQEWCGENLKHFLNKKDTPAKLDDVWCIERLWAIMTQNVYRDPRPKDLAQLKQRIENEWSNISQATTLKLVHEMPLRMAEIVRKKGGRIVSLSAQCLCDRCCQARQI